MTLPVSGDSSFHLDLYSRYLRDPASVPADWRLQFEALDGVRAGPPDPCQIGGQLRDLYRAHGHRNARLDPLGLSPISASREIETALRGLDRSQELRFTLGGETIDLAVEDAIARISSVYCGTASLEADHLTDRDQRAWLYERFEREMQTVVDDDTLAHTLEAIMLADEFESFIKSKWPTKKRFGIEGAESAALTVREVRHRDALQG